MPKSKSVPCTAFFVAFAPVDAAPAVSAPRRITATGPVAVPAVRTVTTAVMMSVTTVAAMFATAAFAARNSLSLWLKRSRAAVMRACSSALISPYCVAASGPVDSIDSVAVRR